MATDTPLNLRRTRTKLPSLLPLTILLVVTLTRWAARCRTEPSEVSTLKITRDRLPTPTLGIHLCLTGYRRE